MTDKGRVPEEGRLRRLLGGPDTAWLVDRVRRRLELGRPLTGTVTLGDASSGQRRAAELILGRRAGGGASLSVNLAELDRVLRSSGACPDGLAAAAEILSGPVIDRAAESASRTKAWNDAHRALDAVLDTRPELAGWRAWLDATGVIRRLVPDARTAREVLAATAKVLERLPSPGIPIGRLAAETCGDAHALDEGQPVGTLALSAARALAGASPAGEGTAESRRAAWAAVGVHLDELSSTVLCLGLPGDASPLGRVLGACREAAEPCLLTLRQLRRHNATIRAGTVRICENPVVVAGAAEELGSSCRPLVCVLGRPSAAAWRLLELLATGGSALSYHGDFDWGGVAIAGSVFARFDCGPWRFDRSAYLAAGGSAELAGRPRPTPWDPGLSEAMSDRGVRIEEELVLADLLTDLRPD